MASRRTLHHMAALLGLDVTPARQREKLISAAGGFVGIFLVLFISSRVLSDASTGLIVASMGASAVLLFAVPHGPLSQPWAVIGGHLLSALVGVTCARMIPNPAYAAPAAVGLAIGVMYYTRCIHPPGGATALTAVIGGPTVHALGYGYVLTPVMLNALAIVALAVVINSPFAWRRYPAALVRRTRTSGPQLAPAISHEHMAYALRQMDSLIDVSEDDLTEIYSLALQHANGTHLKPEQIHVGGCYSNGQTGRRWQVRQVVDEMKKDTSSNDIVLYWVVAGYDGRGCGTCTRAALALWAREQVAPTALAHLPTCATSTAA